MSAGHKPTSPGLGPVEVSRIISDPRIVRRLANKPVIDRSYDLPYLGGYSKNGKTVYIDRHFNPVKQVGARSVNLLPFLVIHETVEKAIMDEYGWKYGAAHAVAEQVEHRAVRAAGILPKQYENWLRPDIKADAREKLTRVPADLDLRPYSDSGDFGLLMHMKSVMAQRAWRRAAS